jgi:arylsulfatase A-like enzyme
VPGPNVLFITVDQWRGDCLSALGHPVVETPNLDRLAARGVLFANHWASTAPCGPSRASLHTGMYLMNHRSVNNGTPLDARFTNVALEAAKVGYDPVLFGYTDTSVDPRTVTDPTDPRLFDYESVLPGFTEVVRLRGDTRDTWAAWLGEHGVDVSDDPMELYEPIPDYPGASEHATSWAPARFPAELSESAFLTDSIIEWIDRHRADRGEAPWFVHGAYLRPHPPHRAAEGYHDRYDPADGPAFRRHPDRDAELAAHPVLGLAAQLFGAPDERELRQLRATYWGTMTEVDHHLGRLFDHLDAIGAADDTVVVLASDHGDQLGDHWFTEKLGWFDESYHVPMLVADPRPAADTARGTRIDAFTEAVDVMPTILTAMGADVPLQCDGHPLQPFLHGESPHLAGGWRDAAHVQWDFREGLAMLLAGRPGLTQEDCNLDVLRTRRHKYVHVADGTSVLYDLDTDPDQLNDVSADPAYAPVLADLRGQLLEWHMRHAERTLTGEAITPMGVVTRREPRR